MRTRLTLLVLAATVVAGFGYAAEASSQDGLAPIYTPADWINAPVSPDSLHGKVVVVDIFTFGCINCQHVVPNLRRLYTSQPHDRFAIVGVHSPETQYEQQRADVVENLKLQGITWPVRIDNDFRVWRAYGIEYWPTQLIFDRNGRLRKTVIGEGQDDVVNATVRELLH
jgi:thiol-disulfide isomerase/thioredoxin